jgi:hypothetical protein
MALPKLSRSRRDAADAASPAPQTIETDLEYVAFDARFKALEAWKKRLVEHQLKLEKLRPRESAPPPLPHEQFEESARDLLANPPSDKAALPASLRLLIAARQLADRALQLGADEGRRTALLALERLRRSREPEWRAACREIAVLAAKLDRAIKARDQLALALCWGPTGKMPLPMSELRVGVARGGPVVPLSEVTNTALLAGYLNKDEL